MVERLSTRQLAVAAAAVLFQGQRALALPQAGEIVAPAPSPWVTIDGNGFAITMTPGVITSNGATTTVSQAPGSLLSTATYTLSPSGHVSTYTGTPPVATAGHNGQGTFLACTVYQDVAAPFCLPKLGSLLYPGKSYYLTWNPAYYGDPEASVAAKVTQDDGTFLGGSEELSASIGYWVWDIPSDFLTKYGKSQVNVTFSLIQAAGDGSTTTAVGPSIWVVNPPADSASGHSVVAVAVPVVVVVVVLLLAGLCFWSWRRHGSVPLIGALGKGRRSSGYGTRKSRSERVGGVGMGIGSSDKPGPNAGIQLTDRDSWSPTGTGNSRNVFREELQRQERQR